MPRVVYRPLAATPQAFIDLSVLYRATDNSPLLRAFLGILRAYRMKVEETQRQGTAAGPKASRKLRRGLVPVGAQQQQY